MHWHKEGQKKEPNKLRHPVDAAQWGNIDSHYGWFADDCRNIRFTMSTDGMNPFGTRVQRIAPCLFYCEFTTFHPGYARNRNT